MRSASPTQTGAVSAKKRTPSPCCSGRRDAIVGRVLASVVRLVAHHQNDALGHEGGHPAAPPLFRGIDVRVYLAVDAHRPEAIREVEAHLVMRAMRVADHDSRRRCHHENLRLGLLRFTPLGSHLGALAIGRFAAFGVPRLRSGKGLEGGHGHDAVAFGTR